MSNKLTLPDQPHIEQLCKRLWSGREYGQAAVMVGAGFSRNAERLSSSTPPFPLWSDLAKVMYGSLYPHNDGSKLSPGETLRLASEYETAFGRSALNDLLLRSIPDTNYYPGTLHELLLSLPWSDVFTTNYDTLIERTLPAIHERKYDIVQTISDIPVLMKPRVVKLHGSFPSHRPYIITEEDFRTYPTKFPPFVNLVQQAIMENVFCLIGFSGDDPNFLYWTGWVRDNLGESTPHIYLIGLLNLTTSQRKLLERRCIIPIDLSPLLLQSDLKDSDLRHTIALEWFLRTLKAGEPQSIKDWPRSSTERVEKPVYDLPAILSSPPSIPDPGEHHPAHDEQDLSAEHLANLYTIWRQTREHYPGWVVLPRDNREALLLFTKYWVEPVLSSIDNLVPPNNLFLIYELNWRLEKTLTPLTREWAEKFSAVINSFNPYPRLVDIPEATIRPDKDSYRDWNDWENVRECWVEVAFSLMRKAREDQDQIQYSIWESRLQNVVKLHPEWLSRWYYEKCLFYLFKLDQENLSTALNEWPANVDLPFWEAKRAMILAEIGELKDAGRIAEASLNEIRSSLQPYNVDYSLLSKEGWVMLLLHMVKLSVYPREETEFISQFGNRWEKLRVYGCDPWSEMEVLASVVKGSDLSPRPSKKVKKRFDPGTVSVWDMYSREPRFLELQPALAFLRIFEEGAVPMKAGFSTLFGDAVTKAAEWVGDLAPFWSLNSIIRTNDKEALEESFDRIRVATMSAQEIEQFRQLLLGPFAKAVQYLSDNRQRMIKERGLFTQNINLLSELLSRLCFRFSTDQLNELLLLAIEIYSQQVTSDFPHIYSYVENLFKRIFYALPQSELLKKIPELLSLPIPKEGKPNTEQSGRVIDPFELFHWNEDTRLDVTFDRTSWDSPIAKLLRVSREQNPIARRHALTRLAKIYDIEGLNTNEKKEFAEALWSETDTRGFPTHTDFYLFAYLILPSPQVFNVKERLREYLLSSDYPMEKHYFKELLYSTPRALPDGYADRDNLIDWTPDETSQLIAKITKWWDENKTKFSIEGNYHKAEDSLGDMSVFLLMQLLSRIVLPRFNNLEDKAKQMVDSLISELEHYGFCVLPILPLKLLINETLYDEIVDKFRQGLKSSDELNVRYSIFGLYNWLLNGANGLLASTPNDLLNELIHKVAARRQPNLDTAIANTGQIIEDLPSILSEMHIRDLVISLDYLIVETQLPNKQKRELFSKNTSYIPVVELPDYRMQAAKLAFQLYRYFQSINKEMPKAVLEWRNICNSDPLPEVRRAWR